VRYAENDEFDTLDAVYRLRFDGAPELNRDYYTEPGRADLQVGSSLRLREGLPGVYFHWEVTEIIEAGFDESDTLVCTLVYRESA
jgi:hypothetical protein